MFYKILAAIFIWVSLNIGAFAAERAAFDLIGYSPDGKYFAFEEYGIQDGSGFAYSTIFIIDVAEDKWVAGAPYRYQAEDEEIDLFSARTSAQSMAEPALLSLNITHPAQALAIKADGDPANPDLELPFNLPGHTGVDAMWGEYELQLSIFDVPSTENCASYMEEATKGFALYLAADGNINLIHQDDNIPKSRGCPLAYRLSAIVVPFQDRNLSRAIALVSVWAFGFEGPDRRFIAVPLNYEE